MHFIQDSYSHWDYAGNINYGQAQDGFSPDHTNVDPPKAKKMAIDTWDSLNEFGRRKNLCCKREEPDWAAIDKFINIGYDLSGYWGSKWNVLRQISNDQLREKIQALGVPWRSNDGRSVP
jgi:hypothetical protein